MSSENLDSNIGTQAVSERQRFDIGALDAWMRDHVEGFRGPVTVEQFKGGQSNPTFKLTTPGHSYVMRSKPGPAAKLLPSAHAVEREFRVLSALADTDVPVARVYGLCEDEGVIGRAFYLMQHVEGRIFWDPALPSLTAGERGAIFDAMNRDCSSLSLTTITSGNV